MPHRITKFLIFIFGCTAPCNLIAQKMFSCPVKDKRGTVIVFPEFYRDDGIEIACQNCLVYSAYSGTVAWIQHSGKLNFLQIKHDRYYSFEYNKLEALFITKGQTVKRGQVIGRMGKENLGFKIFFSDYQLWPCDRIICNLRDSVVR